MKKHHGSGFNFDESMRKYLYDDGVGYVELVDFMGNDLTVVNSARVSFNKHKTVFDKDDEKLVRYLIRNKHTSTLEHNVVTFRIKVPLFVRSQHHRHRMSRLQPCELPAGSNSLQTLR